MWLVEFIINYALHILGTSKTSQNSMSCLGICSFFEIGVLALWHLSYVDEMIHASLKMVGQKKPQSSTFLTVSCAVKCPPTDEAWQKFNIDGISWSGMHLRMIWSLHKRQYSIMVFFLVIIDYILSIICCCFKWIINYIFFN